MGINITDYKFVLCGEPKRRIRITKDEFELLKKGVQVEKTFAGLPIFINPDEYGEFEFRGLRLHVGFFDPTSEEFEIVGHFKEEGK